MASIYKAAFRDGLALRYNWPLSHLPLQCVCGHSLDVDHALSCARGGLLAQRHNHVRDLTATLLAEVAHNVVTEPHLQPLTGEHMRYVTTPMTLQGWTSPLMASGEVPGSGHFST